METFASLQNKVDVVKEELNKMTEEDIKSTTTLKTKITDLQNGLNVATSTCDNEFLTKNVKDALDDLEAGTN